MALELLSLAYAYEDEVGREPDLPVGDRRQRGRSTPRIAIAYGVQWVGAPPLAVALVVRGALPATALLPPHGAPCRPPPLWLAVGSTPFARWFAPHRSRLPLVPFDPH